MWRRTILMPSWCRGGRNGGEEVRALASAISPRRVVNFRVAEPYIGGRRWRSGGRAMRIGFIGGGNMAEAMINGMTAKQVIKPEQLVVADLNPERREIFEQMGIQTVDRIHKAVDNSDMVVLAIKPQMLSVVMDDIKDTIPHRCLLLSVLAGVKLSHYTDLMGKDACVIRAMPNTPAMIGQGITVWSQTCAVSAEQHELTRSILGSFGEEIFVDDENNLDMATALSGTGPAYFFLVAEAMIDAGVHIGFPRHVAAQLVKKTMLGSALYMKNSTLHPAILRNNITSPGGTTAAAMYRAEKNGFRAVLADCIWAAYERCVELGSNEPAQRKRPRS